MSQLSFSDQEYSGRKRITKREEFLKTMNHSMGGMGGEDPSLLPIREARSSHTRN